MVKTVYNDTSREAIAHLTVDKKTFTVREATLEEYRSFDKFVYKFHNVSQLEGIETYINCGPALKQALVGYGDPLVKALFAESVKGIIEAETFLFRERGFATAEEYLNFWNNLYSGSCRYYSETERRKRNWFDYVGTTKREGILFSRIKNQTLFKVNQDNFLLTGDLSDPFHELSVSIMLLGHEMRVEKAEGELLRCPDRICEECAQFFPGLVGKRIREFSKKQIANILGTNFGCVHLIDVTFDMAQALDLAVKIKA